MNTRKNIIALAGSSGAGKTTLARAISVKYGLKFIEQSAGGIISGVDRAYLESKYGYAAEGQAEVIRKSALDKNFAIDFQNAILNARLKIIERSRDLVMDRSPIDVIAFYLNQVVHHFNDELSWHFIRKAWEACKGIDGVIFVRVNNVTEIEDDGSRVPNKLFQEKIDKLFEMALNTKTLTPDNMVLLNLTEWNWPERMAKVSYFIESLGIKQVEFNEEKIPKPEALKLNHKLH